MSEFSCDTMIRLPNDTFSVTVDGSVIIGKYVEYYIEARDKYLALTRSPSSGTNYEVNIDQPPKITYKGEGLERRRQRYRRDYCSGPRR